MRITIAIFLGLLVSCGASTMNEKSIKVACAANMLFAMDSIAVLFEAEHGIKCEITAGSSGVLSAQIENGAPYDVFVSANMNYPESIFQNGNGSEPVIYAEGRLLLVVNKESKHYTIDAVLNDPEVKRIGIADDRTAPYGMAASQYLTEKGKKEGLKDRLVQGESIGQINQYILTGAVDAAFTSYSFKVKNESNYKYFEVDRTYFDPINQGAMILDHGKDHNIEAANKLLDFFSSKKCKDVLNYFGYLTE
tara:strand:- start:595 stop:1344 length:750 start_codon:yes stop_codon:yes gene_type:complete